MKRNPLIARLFLANLEQFAEETLGSPQGVPEWLREDLGFPQTSEPGMNALGVRQVANRCDILRAALTEIANDPRCRAQHFESYQQGLMPLLNQLAKSRPYIDELLARLEEEGTQP